MGKVKNKQLIVCLGRTIDFFKKIYWYLWRDYQKTLFEEIGTEVYIGRNCSFTYQNVCIGNDVYIGNNALFSSIHGKIIIGSHIMFGPNVQIHGGNHKYDCVGVYMKSIKDKNPLEDGIIEIGDDVWIGSGVIILKGVTIGRGSIIGAGCVINKNVDPYTIVVGNLPRKVIERFDSETISRHEKLLNLRGESGE